jgi:VWFA-related protein
MVVTIRLLALSLAASSVLLAQGAVRFDISTTARDLRAGDFQISDNGKRQNIVFFDRISAQPDTPTVILFDLDQLSPRDYSETELVATLKSQTAASDLFLYLRTEEGILPIRPLTPEKGAADPGWTVQIQSLLDASVKNVQGLNFPEIRSTTRACRDVELLISDLLLIPGRKNLIWVTYGFLNALDRNLPGNSSRPVVDLIADLTENQIVVYPLERTYGEEREKYTAESAHRTLEVLAAITGGRFDDLGAPEQILRSPDNHRGFYNFRKAIDRAREDTRNLSYRLAFLRPAADWNAKYHNLRVVSTRKDVKLQTREGDYAFPPPSDEDRNQIATAASARRESPDIVLHATAVAPQPPLDKITIDIRVDAATILLAPDHDQFHTTLTVAVVQYDAAGSSQISPSSSMELTLTPDQRTQALAEGLDLKVSVPFLAAARTLRVIVHDRFLKTTGSLTIPI